MSVRICGWMLVIGALAGGVAAYEAPATGVLPDVQEVIRGYEAQAAEVQRKLDAELKTIRERTLQQLQTRQDEYTRTAKLDEAVAVRDLIKSLKASWESGAPLGGPVLPNPGSLTSYRNKVGQTLLFDVTGSDGGIAWGTDVYTADSSLAVAAVHAGVLKVGQKGVVRVTILEGQTSHPGSSRNGVTTSTWSSYGTSYRIETPTGLKLSTASAVEEAPSSLNVYRGQNGTVKRFKVTGATTGWVWGSDIYTDDSSLAAAAVHAGILKPGEQGVVKVTILAGQSSYVGGTRNGVTAFTFGGWQGSYRVEADGQ